MRHQAHNYAFSFGTSRPNFLISGQINAMTRTTRTVAMPPETTEIIAPVEIVLPNFGPNKSATMPDSVPPSSFDVPIKRLLTAETRPRISSGVSNCTSVCRTITLMLSANPQTKSIANDNQKILEKPKTTVATPKTITDQSSAGPALRNGGRCAINRAQMSEPIGNAEFKIPNPPSPACKIPFA